MQEMLVGLQVAIMLLSVQNITYRSSSGLRIRESLKCYACWDPVMLHR